MFEQRNNELINELLIAVHRSLLQYSVECWPWTAPGEASEQDAITDMVQEQQIFVHRLVELLLESEFTIDFGGFPTEFTDLHYVALDFMLQEMIKDEEFLIAQLERGHAVVADDVEASSLLAELTAAERRHLTQLRELAAAHPPETVTR